MCVCKQDISSREAWTDLIFSMWVYHIEYKNPIVFGVGQRSFGVNSGQIVKTMISQEWKLGQLSYLVYHIEYKSLLFLVEVKCHLGSSDF